MKSKFILVGVLMLVLTLTLVACGGSAPEATPCPTVEPCPDCPAAPECPACPECPAPEEPVVEYVPFEEQWAASSHADETAEAFTHWDGDDPPEIPVDCARCHSTTGYLEYLGDDGSEPGAVENNQPIGQVIDCLACHNETATVMDTVVFPSGLEITGLGAEARCMQCHQGQASKLSVDQAIELTGLTEEVDTISEELGFINIHYFPAAATLYGTAVQGGYEYDGKAYDFKNDHVKGYDTCIGCHDSHTLQLKLDECAVCHEGVSSVENVRQIRMQGSEKDYDGDGDIEEGIASEIDSLRQMLYQALQVYAADVSEVPVVYAASYPYYFIDTNANGEPDGDEANFGNLYNAWTPRLLKAAYNYQMATKDPGAYAHGGKYIIQLLYDSIEDLNEVISNPVDLSMANRIDAGHFAGSEEAFRHWDEDDPAVVPASCSRCHSAAGVPRYIHEGVNISEDIANGLNCATCHDDLANLTRFEVSEVEFPSGATASFDSPDSNLCMLCHQGRMSTVQIDDLIASTGVGEDEQAESLTVRDGGHYFAAGATLFGSQAAGAYQYAGKEYAGQNRHVDGFRNCIQCHTTHGLTLEEEKCTTCHAPAETIYDIRFSNVDYDGDGDTSEGIAGEIETMHEALYEAMQNYTAAQGLPGILYAPSYPYFFTDANENGQADAEEIEFANQYANFTPRLLRAAYNYQWVAKDPGAFAHNSKYVLQFLYDSLENLGAAEGMTRP
jgi:hypothetical protein